MQCTCFLVQRSVAEKSLYMVVKTIADAMRGRQTDAAGAPALEIRSDLRASLCKRADQFIKLREDCGIVGTRVARQILAILIEIEQKRLDPLFV